MRALNQAQRRAAILSAAEELFLCKGIDDTLMSEVAARVGVSTPTVFNYFGTKVELLLAVIMKAHDAARERVEHKRATWHGDVPSGVVSILQVFSGISHRILSKQAWRYAEATNISHPQSEFVQAYQKIDAHNTALLQAFLAEALPPRFKQTGTAEVLARTLYNNWLARFIAFIRDDGQSVDSFHALVRQDVHELLGLLLDGSAPSQFTPPK
ncbi:hypothetical protein C6W91_19875 [Phaeobacter sp. SYSU ZJ3003]